MTDSVLEALTTQGPIVLILGTGGYFMIKYFMGVVEKKDQLNQDNLNRFIDLQKESNIIHTKTSELLNTMMEKVNDIHTKISK